MAANETDGAPGASNPATVLVVEDEILIRMAAVDDFIRAGHKVIEAASADEAVAVLEAGLEVDVIFSDIHMPGALDGLALLQTVRDKYPSISVILTSGHTVPPVEELDGRYFFLPKPYLPRAVLDLVQREIARREKTDEPRRSAQRGHTSD